jgi:hypothetical protein
MKRELKEGPQEVRAPSLPRPNLMKRELKDEADHNIG